MTRLKYLSAKDLNTLMLDPQRKSKLAIIDVRDDDFKGGNIKGAKNFPSLSLLQRMNELIDFTKDKDDIVFHCSFSQTRAPKAAQDYCRARSQMQNSSSMDWNVYVLEHGFRNWQKEFGTDKNLTENYDCEGWAKEYYS